VRFQIGEVNFTASIAEAAERAITIQFRAPKLEMHEQLLQAAHQRANVLSLDDDKEWRVANVSFAYVGSEPWGMHHHTWRLEQVSRVAVGVLRIGDVALQPYDYREETAEDGGFRFALRAAVTDSELRALAALTGTFVEVQRSDLESRPRRMLLEGFVWGSSTRHGQAIALVCSEHVEPRVTLAGATPLEPRLLALLTQRGALAHAEVLALREVQDVDAWDL
jgi:hypothetical protein